MAVLLSLACDSAVTYQSFFKLDDHRRSYEVILILQYGGHGVEDLLPFGHFSRLKRSRAIGIPNFDQTSQHLNLRPIYYYFRYWKQRPPHWNRIISISTFSLWSACDSALTYQLLLPTELGRDIDSRWRPWHWKSTSGFWFGHISYAFGAANFDQYIMYLNPLPIYYYFRFPKTNATMFKFYSRGFHIEITSRFKRTIKQVRFSNLGF